MSNREKLFKCTICNVVIKRKSDFKAHLVGSRHINNCINKQEIQEKDIVNAELVNQNNNLVNNLISEKDKTIQYLDSEVRTLTNIINGASALGNQSMSIISYLVKNYSNAPPLITFNDPSIIRIKDNYVDQLIYFYRNNILVNHIVDCIVKEYKKENPEEQSFWTSDTSRLTYIIKEIMKDNTSNWMVDKQGIKMGKYIIDPLLKFIRIDIKTHMSTLSIDIHNLQPFEMEEYTLNLQAASHIISDIDKGILKNKITRELAPFFYMDRKNLLT